MRRMIRRALFAPFLPVACMLIVWYATTLSAQSTVTAPQPTKTNLASWIDPDTNHRVTQLTYEPNSQGLYFNENAFTPDGKEMIYTASLGVYVLNLTTFQSRPLLAAPVRSVVVGKHTPTVYFMRPNDNGIYSIGVDSGQQARIAVLPARATISALNADETLAAGTYEEGAGVDAIKHKADPNLRATAVRATAMDERMAAHLPMILFTVDLHTGQVRHVLHSTDWLNHVQFSPKDPHLIMYCHEGLWFRVDRIWTIRTDGSHNELIHKRTMNQEIAGHEFWDADGKTIWYDLQLPRGQNFYLASFDTESKARQYYHIERDAWSIHYNAASDDSVFCGDGGDYSQVAKSKDGQWIELFSPRKTEVPPEVDQTNLIQSGFMVSQHLVKMDKHNYSLEPNVRFSPDHRLVIFTSNMLGSSHVFAVEVAHYKPKVASSVPVAQVSGSTMQ